MACLWDADAQFRTSRPCPVAMQTDHSGKTGMLQREAVDSIFHSMVTPVACFGAAHKNM